MSGVYHRSCILAVISPLKHANRVIRQRSVGTTNQINEDAPLQSDISPFTEHDWIGPRYPDQSNVRQIRFRRPKQESPLEKKYRLLRENTEKWHVTQWNEHNEDFQRSKKIFMGEKILLKQQKTTEADDQEVPSLTAEEMSEFYKEFLLRTRSRHLAYNWQWYRRNFRIAFLAMRVRLHRLRKLFLS